MEFFVRSGKSLENDRLPRFAYRSPQGGCTDEEKVL